MNFLAWAGPGAVAAAWLAGYVQTDLNEEVLSWAVWGIFVLCLAMAIRGAIIDFKILFGAGNDEHTE